MTCKYCKNARWINDAFKCARGHNNCKFERKVSDVINEELRNIQSMYLVIDTGNNSVIKGFKNKEDATEFRKEKEIKENTSIITVPFDMGPKSIEK